MISESVSHHDAAGAAASMVSPCRCGCQWSRAAGAGASVLRPRRRRQYRHGPASLVLSGREQVRDSELGLGIG
jgi:hypothetical protein